MRAARGRIAAALALALAAAALPGCIGLFVGSAVDQTANAITNPIHEYLFFGAWRYENDPDAPWKDLEDDRARDYGDELVGLAVSGGGSRSAYFLCSALDEMRKTPVAGYPEGKTLLDEIDYISAVSGGSLSSAYYVMKRPRTRDPAAMDAFFEQYRADITKNFERRSLGRMFLLFRWIPMLLTYYDRAHLMAGTWDANLFDDATFADLPPPSNGHPSLIINATSYSTGNSFVLSRIPSRRFRESATFRALSAAALNPGGTDPAYRALQTKGFDTIDCDIGSYPVSMAVAASASVPGLLGPVIVKDRTVEGRLESLGDGGLYDNYGLESLVALFSTILEERPGMKARIIVVDGSGYFPSFQHFADPAVGDYLDRTMTISWQRASGYASLIFQLVKRVNIEEEKDGQGGVVRVARIGDAEDSPFRNLRFHVLSLYHQRTASDLEKEKEGQGFVRDLFTGKPITDAMSTFNQRVRAIGTRLQISDEDADLVRSQASAAVRDEIGGAPAEPPKRR